MVMNNDNPKENIIPEPSKNDVIMTSSAETVDIPLISSSELKETVGFLASDELKGRGTGTEGIEQAAAFIENILRGKISKV